MVAGINCTATNSDHCKLEKFSVKNFLGTLDPRKLNIKLIVYNCKFADHEYLPNSVTTYVYTYSYR